ncbi:MAG: hypothetical protein QM621_09255 [Aeromicrobium sp.]
MEHVVVQGPFGFDDGPPFALLALQRQTLLAPGGVHGLGADRRVFEGVGEGHGGQRHRRGDERLVGSGGPFPAQGTSAEDPHRADGDHHRDEPRQPQEACRAQARRRDAEPARSVTPHRLDVLRDDEERRNRSEYAQVAHALAVDL